ncbi:MAG TPA: hypothetical protein VJV97_04075 [Gemmatimonadaceae bacterium]|nr:hypothetical protein [Gemmatimonadaceae bacterium]
MKLRMALHAFPGLKVKLRTLFTLCIGLTSAMSLARAQDTTAAAPDTAYVEYHDSPLSLPLLFGLRTPTYDRVNGLALPWGPKLEMSDGRLDVDGLITYRSNLGKWDPSLEGVIRPGDSQELKFFVGRGTFTNDSWIRDDLTNSAASLLVGSDARNYFRGDRATARFATTLTRTSISFTPFIGANLERDWSTGSVAPTKSPWSFFGRRGKLRMRRPNPPVFKGSIASILGGTGLQVVNGGLEAKLDATLERSLRISQVQCSAVPGLLVCPIDNFTQATLDGKLRFPTFGSQTFTFKGHTVVTGGGGIALGQRFAYLGGAGTLATVDLLALGGDHLLFVSGDYMIPIEQVQLPFVGNPFVALSYAAGSAGINGVPRLIQNLGIGVGVSLLRVDLSIDPASNRSPFSRRSAVTFGASLSL